MKKIIVILTIIVLAGIGISEFFSTPSSSSYNPGVAYSYSYNYTCYKCHNKGYYECDTCHGNGYVTEYYSTPNYSGTGSCTVSKNVDCSNCVDGVADCHACYN